MVETREDNPRVRFAKNVVSRSKELGMSQRLIEKILPDNRMIFLSKINYVIERNPDVHSAYLVVRRARNLNYAVSVMGPWVLNLTKNVRTLKEILKFYLEFKAEEDRRFRGEV